MNNFIWILPALFVAMVIQVALSMIQYQRFYSRVRQMRKDSGGRAAIGMAGSNWRAKAYGVLIVSDQDVIIRAEKLTGLTVFSRLKPVDSLAGLSLTRLDSDEPVEGICDPGIDLPRMVNMDNHNDREPRPPQDV